MFLPLAFRRRAWIQTLVLLLLAAPMVRAENSAPPPLFADVSSAAAWSVSATGAANSKDDAHYEELLLEARVNGLPPAVTLLALRDRQGRLWLPAENFSFWDMHPPAAALQYQGRDFRLLDGQAGLAYRLAPSRLTLDLEATPSWFTGNRVDSGMNERTKPPAVNPGGFFNYDLNIAHSDSDTYTAGLFEAGVFGNWGVGTSTLLARNGQAGQDGGLLRLDTTWTRDLPERRASLRLGDAIGGASAWGRPVRFGGVQWATNFGTQPGFISFPLPAIQGEAALPSTLELYVNGMRRMSSEVPTGPFSIPDLPAVTGQGQVQLVVRDLLGREQVITDSFYVSARLLQQGLHEFSYELGAERQSYGMESNDYGRAFATGTHRLGLSDRFTAEARVEALSGQYTAGLGGALLLGRFGVVHGSLAGSHSERGEGGLAMLGFEHSSRRLGFGFNLQLASAEFAQLGLLEDEPAPRRLGQAWISLPLWRAGSVSLSYVHRDERDRERFESLSASYQVSLGRVGHLGVFATRIQSEQDDTLIGLNFTRPLGTRTTSSANANLSDDGEQLLFGVQRSLPVGRGMGYRARAGMLDQERLDAGLSVQNDYGTWHVDVSHANSQTGIRASAAGGVAFLDGGLHFSRRMDDSFGVVRVGDFEGVRIYADNQHVATTDADGRALLPRLRAYEENPLRIEVGDLPLDARVAQVDQKAVPYFRSGLVVDFAVSRSRNAIFRLLRASGEPVPAGSIITAPNGERFPVGYEGEAFVTGVDTGTSLSARWNGTSCAFELVLPETDDPMPDLGTLTCRETQP
jgi:outer membrane usher protein